MLHVGVVALLAGCDGSEHNADSLPQRWQNLDVRVESRPSPPAMGMNEFLVIITGAHGAPVWDCRVNIRTSEADPWKQSIEDGRVGVYRRAALVEAGQRSVLQVQLRCQGDETVLRFPLNLTAH